ncbi:helix-turn-helix domain-containing protein [Deinococcus frigens]|uniref:helix-turn-helix domain-containing protein n=1 Tax=Deinococcus frigens TaxID=249403 RepID=UPI0012EB50DB|nr:helix-turn-helix domain-containing protein [Deinococcus frigens]
MNTNLTNTATHGTMKRACPRRTGPFPSDRVKGTRRVYMKEQKTLNQWRKERGLEVGELSEKVGAGTSLLRWLYRGVTPKLKMCLALAEALDVELSQILWDKEEPQEVPAMPEGQAVTANQSRVSREQYEVAKTWLEAGRTKTEIANAMNVSRETLYNAFRRFEKQDAPGKPSKGPVHQTVGSKTRTPKAKAAKAGS